MINSKRIFIPNYYCAASEVDEVTKVAGICPVLDNKSPQKWYKDMKFTVLPSVVLVKDVFSPLFGGDDT